MTISFRFKLLIIATTIVAMVVGGFFVHALAGLGARPVVFAEPPAFVEQYAAAMDHSDPSTPRKELESANLTTIFPDEEALVHKVIFDGESPDLLLRLFAHPEKAQRVRMAAALAAVNAEFTHNEESGFPEKRTQFWIDVEDHLPNIQNALFEALITSAEEGTTNKIPYTLAWMPGQDHKTIEVLAWAANHHPDSWARRFSVFFVIQHGGNETLAAPLLQNGHQDPSYTVRKEVLRQRWLRFTGGS